MNFDSLVRCYADEQPWIAVKILRLIAGEIFCHRPDGRNLPL
jgi:hypothetical protein